MGNVDYKIDFYSVERDIILNEIKDKTPSLYVAMLF